MNIIETTHLEFTYQQKSVLNAISIQIPKGCIYGYLGKNGSGKTTTLKILLGLLPAKKGDILYDGKDFFKHRIEVLKKVGNLIEMPSLYPHFTAYEQLRYLDYYFHKGSKRIHETLELIGLSQEANKKIKNFSTGMKQRLGIGMAIFHDPEILLLDEPINGLDPKGVFDIRELLLYLQSQGKTIILSSHILSEIEKLCSHVGILENGNLLYQGTMTELIATTERKVVLRTPSVSILSQLLNELHCTIISIEENLISFKIKNDNDFNNLLHQAIENGIIIYDIYTSVSHLEDIYLELIAPNT